MAINRFLQLKTLSQDIEAVSGGAGLWNRRIGDLHHRGCPAVSKTGGQAPVLAERPGKKQSVMD